MIAPANAATMAANAEKTNKQSQRYEARSRNMLTTIFQGVAAKVRSCRNANIKATNFQNVTLAKYENYLAQQLPVIYQPNYANPFNEIATNLKGATPLNVLQALTPENWRWAS